MDASSVLVGTGPVAPEDVVRVARDRCGVRLTDDALAEIARSRAVIDGLAGDDQPHYGVSTGFGALATKHIPLERRAHPPRRLIPPHAPGSRPPGGPQGVR